MELNCLALGEKNIVGAATEVGFALGNGLTRKQIVRVPAAKAIPCAIDRGGLVAGLVVRVELIFLV